MSFHSDVFLSNNPDTRRYSDEHIWSDGNFSVPSTIVNKNSHCEYWIVGYDFLVDSKIKDDEWNMPYLIDMVF